MPALCRHYRRNLRAGAALSMLMTSGVAMAQTYGWSDINNITKPFLGGATLIVLGMALTGTLIGLGLTPHQVKKRGNLFVLIPACTILSAVFLMYIQDRVSWLTVKDPVMLPPLALMVAAAGVVIIPALFKPDFTGLLIQAIKDTVGRLVNRPPQGGA